MSERGPLLPAPFVAVLVMYSIASAFLVASFMRVHIPMVLPYGWHKTLHVTGAVLFIGNMLVTGFWAGGASRQKSPSIVRFSLKMIVWADVAFTGPGFLLLLANGAIIAGPWGGVYRHSWIVAAVILLGITGLFSIALLPIQLRMYRLAMQEPDAPLPAEYERAMRAWSIWGSLASLPPIAILVLMTLKPILWW